MVKGIGFLDVPRDLGPLGTGRFAANDPYRGIGAVTRNQVSPVPFDAGDTGIFHAVAVGPSPPAYDRRNDARLHQVLDAPIRVFEVGRVNDGEIPG